LKDTHVVSAQRRRQGRHPLSPLRRGGISRATRRGAALVSLAVLATVTLLAGTASSAFAIPTNCTTVNGGTWAESRCTGGTGEHRVVMRQQHFMPGAGMIVCEGPWVPVGTVSHTGCAAHTVISVTAETRESTGGPGMGPQPVPPTMPPPPVNCHITGNGSQLYVLPIGFKALWYGFTLEYCYNSAPDLVRVTPHISLPQVQLPLEEVSRGLPVGTVGTISVTSAIPLLGGITTSDPPIRTSQGQLYIGTYTVNFTFTPRGGALQTYQSTVGVTINRIGAILSPPVLIRFS